MQNRTLYNCRVCNPKPEEPRKRPECFEKMPSGKLRDICRRDRQAEQATKNQRQAEFNYCHWLNERWRRI